MKQPQPQIMSEVDGYAAEIADLGRRIGLPFIAVSADLSSPDPMVDAQKRPYAETLFQWLDPKLEYWKDRGFALKSPFVLAARFVAEPFYFADNRLGSWRASPSLDAIDAGRAASEHGVRRAIISPTYPDAHGKLPSPTSGRLTRREIQCLKWAAAGKTDTVIAELVGISAPTVRFHLKNAAEKLNVIGRSQAVREAAALGYVGLELNPARHAQAEVEGER